MDWLVVLGNLAGGVAALLILVALTWLIAQAARRVLGVRVGWPRAFFVSLLAQLGVSALLNWMYEAGMLPIDDHRYALMATAYALLVVLWAFAVGAALLVGLEVLVPSGSLPPLRDIILGWGPRWRRGQRYAAIMAIAAKHGLSAHVRGFRRPDADESASRVAASLREALEEAGITFVKLGQMLSTRSDLLPETFIRELSRLQSSVAPSSWEPMRAQIELSLGRPITEVFESIDHEPLASASVAQVYAATLPGGRRVVVKVQRPGARQQVERDLEILARIARTLERNAPWAQQMRITSLVRGFAISLREELDYGVEVDNMRALKASLDRRQVRIPDVVTSLSGPEIIVMERFDGEPMSRGSATIAAMTRQQRRKAASVLLQATLNQIVNDGLFHSDLHPGNVLVWPDGSVGLLDFGSVGRLDAISRRNLAMLLWAIDADDPAIATDSLMELLDRPEGLDGRALTRDLGMLLTRFRGGMGSGGSLAVFSEVFQLIVDHGFAIPPQIAAALRSLGALEGTLKQLDPDLDLVEEARATGRGTIGDLSPARVRDELAARAMRLLPLIEHLPRRIDKITEDIERGRLTAHVRVLSHPDDRVFLSELVQQLVVAVLSAASVLGGIILVTNGGGPMFLPGVTLYTVLGSLLTFAGFVLALRAVAMVFGRS